MTSLDNHTIDKTNGQQGNITNSSNDNNEFQDADTLLDSVKGEGLVNLNEGTEIFGLNTILKNKKKEIFTR